MTRHLKAFFFLSFIQAGLLAIAGCSASPDTGKVETELVNAREARREAELERARAEASAARAEAESARQKERIARAEAERAQAQADRAEADVAKAKAEAQAARRGNTQTNESPGQPVKDSPANHQDFSIVGTWERTYKIGVSTVVEELILTKDCKFREYRRQTISGITTTLVVTGSYKYSDHTLSWEGKYVGGLLNGQEVDGSGVVDWQGKDKFTLTADLEMTYTRKKGR